MNVLGEVKFALPNPMNIYLHSTSAKELFQHTRRDLSHGCIRVERPAELAEFVLDDARQWDADAVRAAMQPGPTRKVALARPVPVVLFYATAVVDREGRSLFAEDIYDLDRPLYAALRGGSGAFD
jgi:murein L,D-transpeptidase YcbB/YkuD